MCGEIFRRAVRRRLSVLKHSTRTYLDFASFFGKQDVDFVSQGVSNERYKKFVTLDDVFQLIPREQLVENVVFIKMDIEQSELEFFPVF
jgi:hypothetical protein